MKIARKVLVALADPATWRARLERILPRPQWQLEFADNVSDARTRFDQSWDLDLLLVDFKLREGNGRELLAHVRAHDENTPVFLFSSESEVGFTAHDVARFSPVPALLDKAQAEGDGEALEQLNEALEDAYEDYMADLCTPRVHSETGQLRVVLVHTPAEEINYIDPLNLHDYLFESRPEMGHMVAQHQTFLRTLKEKGKRPICLDVGRLLFDIIEDGDFDLRMRILEESLLPPTIRRTRRIFGKEGVAFSDALEKKLHDLCKAPAREMTDIIMRGLNIVDFGSGKPDQSKYGKSEYQLVKPAANLYFMRDPAFVLGNTLVLSRMHWPVRRRETAILREIIRHHPFMKKARLHLIDHLLDGEDQLSSIEGGDVMVIGEGRYAIAESERTNRQSIRKLAEAMFERQDVEIIYQPVIPARRAFIHLDTVCSIAGEDYVVIHPEAVSAYPNTLVWTREIAEQRGEPESLNVNFTEVLERDCGYKLVETAGGGHMAHLEQFDDATNVFMVKQDTAVAYDRNRQTNRVLNEHGINVVEFAGSDLVMGRGGPRCMTMPLNRD